MSVDSNVANDAQQHMDQIYRYQRYIYDLSRKFYLLGRDKLIDELNAPQGGTILEVGCGTGRNLIKAAKKYPTCKLYGFDVSTAMLETAENSLKRSNVKAEVQFAQGDATCFNGEETFGVGTYDCVFISYALSMIPPWREALDCALGCVKPGGSLHIVDFGQQQKLPKWFRSVLYAWLRLFSVHPQAELHDELVKVAERHNAKLEYKLLYGGYSEFAVITK